MFHHLQRHCTKNWCKLVDALRSRDKNTTYLLIKQAKILYLFSNFWLVMFANNVGGWAFITFFFPFNYCRWCPSSSNNIFITIFFFPAFYIHLYLRLLPCRRYIQSLILFVYFGTAHRIWLCTKYVLTLNKMIVSNVKTLRSTFFNCISLIQRRRKCRYAAGDCAPESNNKRLNYSTVCVMW